MRRSPWWWLFPLSIIIAILCDTQQVYAQAPGAQAEKPRIAIRMPAIGEGVSRRAAKHLALSILLDELEASLRATRKFDLLTRQKEELKALREEQQFSKSPLSKGQAAKEGLFEAANYIVMPTIQDFKFYRSVRMVPNISNKYVRRDSGMLQMSVQVLDTESGQIKATFRLKSSFATKDQVVNTKGGSPSSVHFTQMAKAVAAELADQLLDTIFPMRIAVSEGERVWIPRGDDGGLKVGQVLDVFRPGKQIVDPYTKEVLGSAERLIGKVKVVRVNPKITIAEVVRESLKEPPREGDILRKP